ncbi:MoaB/Mog domain-containing protein [Mycena pura]|uniref:MoaB/Mog domain-containing protein n=1 Tax=Mycena pura TaxID=153505 RepID=A0AAD6YLQ4_9AGAR|nr:MoaB/Mog domain-containing protein [Mycena pura]
MQSSSRLISSARRVPSNKPTLFKSHTPRTRPALLLPPFSHRAVSTQPTMSQGPSPRPADVPRFSVSPVPKNHLGEGRCIRTAAALIIGDEILNGKTHDTNSNFFAKYCFEHGIDLKRIEVIADEEEEIIEASRRMVRNYDFVVTTGGVGSTHDDITYGSLAKAFSQSLVHHEETLVRMTQMIQRRHWFGTQTPQQRAATERMALFPDRAEVLFVAEDIWVPVVRLEGKLCIFPGIPSLFQKMVTALTPLLPLPPLSERPLRIQVFTERPESMIAPYLTKLQTRLKPHGIQVGSYPALGQGVFVSLIGLDRCLTTAAASLGSDGHESGGAPRLADIAREVGQEIGGHVLSDAEVAKRKDRNGLAAPGELAASLAVKSDSMGNREPTKNIKAKY